MKTTYENPAQEGIDAAKKDAQKRQILKDRLLEFKEFVLDSAPEHQDDFVDEVAYLAAAMDMFVNMVRETESDIE